MTRTTLLAAGCLTLALAGCGSNPAATYAAVQSDTQLAYTALKASADTVVASGKLDVATVAKVQAAETAAGAEVAAFATTTAPNSVAAALVDLQTLAAALPASSVSQDAKVALAAAQGAWATYSAARPVTTAGR